MPIFQSAMRESTISIAGKREFDGGITSAIGQVLALEIAAEHEGDLGLDLWLDQLRIGDVPPSGTAMSSNSMP